MGTYGCERIFRLYMRRLRFINNCDVVDVSAAPIVGGWLASTRAPSARKALGGHDRKNDLLARLARSRSVWSRRVAMIATLHFTVRGDHSEAIRVATQLVNDDDLIQKAVGWMLREVGKRASLAALRRFLRQHAATMPRTALRYAIERLPPAERARWMRAHLECR